MKIAQLENHSGNAWANQFVISFEKYRIDILQSYKSLVVMIDKNEKHVTLGEDWDYSKTTLRAVVKFLNDYADIETNTAEIRKALKSGTIQSKWCKTPWTIATGCADFFEDFLRGGEQ